MRTRGGVRVHARAEGHTPTLEPLRWCARSRRLSHIAASQMHATRTDTYDNAYHFTYKLRATYDGVSAFLFTRTLRGLAAMCIICTSRAHSTRHALYDYVDAAIRQHPMIEL